MSNIVVANIFGLLSGIVFGSSFFIKEKKGIVSRHLVCNISDGIQYGLLGSMSGVWSCVLHFIQNIVFIKYNSTAIVLIVRAITAISYLMNYEGTISLFLVAATIAGFVGMCILSEQGMRLTAMFNTSVWIVYDSMYCAYIAVFAGILTFIFEATSFVKYNRLGYSIIKSDKPDTVGLENH